MMASPSPLREHNELGLSCRQHSHRQLVFSHADDVQPPARRVYVSVHEAVVAQVYLAARSVDSFSDDTIRCPRAGLAYLIAYMNVSHLDHHVHVLARTANFVKPPSTQLGQIIQPRLQSREHDMPTPPAAN